MLKVSLLPFPSPISLTIEEVIKLLHIRHWHWFVCILHRCGLFEFVLDNVNKTHCYLGILFHDLQFVTNLFNVSVSLK